ncbi:MAG: AAA family ATPase [Stenotrophomonas sp.]|uniref:AAA family ATPase n=1 Tax=Stenotrophomonas sp. TaxID=69392 RepID=UPI003D6C83AF
MQAVELKTGFMKRRVYLERLAKEGSHPARYRSQARIQSGVDTRVNPRGTAPGAGLERRKQRLARFKRQPLKPQHPSHPKEIDTMNVSALPTAQLEEITTEQLSDLRERIRAVAEDDKSYSQARIAREADLSTATVSQFLGGSYNGNLQNVGRKLTNWLKAFDERNSTGKLPEGPEWVKTQTGERIIAGLRYAQMASDIVVICGGAGVGKTKAIDRYRQQTPNVWHVELTPATGSVLTCLQEIALSMGLRDLTNSSAYLQRAIFAKVRGTNGLLVLDEAQHLSVPALDQVRAINDQAGIGLVLCGNERVYQQMSGGNRAAYLDRLYSRIGKKIVLRKASVADADAIITAWGIEDTPCKEQIRSIAAMPGALRVLNKVLRLAAIYAKANNRRICCDSIKYAAQELGVLG